MSNKNKKRMIKNLEILKELKSLPVNNLKMVTPEFSYNTSWLGNPSVDIYISWVNINEISDDLRFNGKYYIIKLISVTTYNKWINIDKFASNIKNAFDNVYQDHTYLRKHITSEEFVRRVKNDFDCYTNGEVLDLKKTRPEMLLND